MNIVDLTGKRILITQSNEFMGPTLRKVLAGLGAEVMADVRPLADPDLPERLVKAAGHVDVLVVNLVVPAPSTPVGDVTEQEWKEVFSHLVDPLPRLVRAVLPQMQQRQSGKILVMGSASALRGMKRAATYSAARGAQLAYV